MERQKLFISTMQSGPELNEVVSRLKAVVDSVTELKKTLNIRLQSLSDVPAGDTHIFTAPLPPEPRHFGKIVETLEAISKDANMRAPITAKQQPRQMKYKRALLDILNLIEPGNKPRPVIPVRPKTPELPVRPKTPEIPVRPMTPEIPVRPKTPEAPPIEFTRVETTPGSYWIARTSDNGPINERTDGLWISQLVDANSLIPHNLSIRPAPGSVLFFFVTTGRQGRLSYDLYVHLRSLLPYYSKIFVVRDSYYTRWSILNEENYRYNNKNHLLDIAVDPAEFVYSNTGFGGGEWREGQGVLNMKAAKRLFDEAVEEARQTLQCAFCTAPASNLCAQCTLVPYCSEICQKRHWALHSLVCDSD